MKKGKLYGVGVGPGDPELMTLKAVRIIENVNNIAFPGANANESYAYKIAEAAVPKIKGENLIPCHVNMVKDKKILDETYDAIAADIMKILDSGEDVAYLTIGDPTVYATYMYIHERVEDAGYMAELVNGVPSFCAAAAKLDISLAERSEELHIIPSSYNLDEALNLPGNKIFMKAGRKLPELKKKLADIDGEVYMVENCGLSDEHIYKDVQEIDEKAGYLSLVIVKSEKLM